MDQLVRKFNNLLSLLFLKISIDKERLIDLNKLIRFN